MESRGGREREREREIEMEMEKEITWISSHLLFLPQVVDWRLAITYVKQNLFI